MSTISVRLVISMLVILLAILITFYINTVNGLDQSVQFIYFMMMMIIFTAVYGILFIRDRYKDHWIHICIIGVIVICAAEFGFLSLEELNKVEINVIGPHIGSSVHAQFIVSGLFKNIPENKDIWLYIVPSVNKKYYPESTPVTKLNDGHSGYGSWEYYCINGITKLKRLKSDGKHFQIGIFISNRADRIYIEQEIMRVNGSIHGMNQLPDGIEDLGIQTNVTNI